MNPANDNELLAALKQGSKAAFERLYKENLRLLWCEAFRLLDNKEEAEDAVQELFIDVWEKRLFDKVESNMRAYLFTCIRRKCYKLLERRKNLKEISANAGEQSHIYYPNNYENKELNNEIAAAMTKMPPQSSKVFELYVLEGKKRKEAAREMGISDNTAKSYLAAALKIARAKLLNFKKDTPI